MKLNLSNRKQLMKEASEELTQIRNKIHEEKNQVNEIDLDSVALILTIATFITNWIFNQFSSSREQDEVKKYIKSGTKYYKSIGWSSIPERALSGGDRKLQKALKKDFANIDSLKVRPEVKKEMNEILDDMIYDVLNRQEFVNMVNRLGILQSAMFYNKAGEYTGDQSEDKLPIEHLADVEREYDELKNKRIPDYIIKAITQNNRYKNFADRLNKELPELKPEEVKEIQEKYINTIKSRLRYAAEKLHVQTNYNIKEWEKWLASQD